MSGIDDMLDRARCGKPRRHTPHWHGPGETLWCDGKKIYKPLPLNGLVLVLLMAVSALVFLPSERAEAGNRDNGTCWSRSEYRSIPNTYPQRRPLYEKTMSIKPLRNPDGSLFDGSKVWNPTNPNLYVRAYAICGYDPFTQLIAVGVYRRGSDMFLYGFFGLANLGYNLPDWLSGKEVVQRADVPAVR